MPRPPSIFGRRVERSGCSPAEAGRCATEWLMRNWRVVPRPALIEGKVSGRDGRAMTGALCPFPSLVSGVPGNDMGGSPSGVDPVWEIDRLAAPVPVILLVTLATR